MTDELAKQVFDVLMEQIRAEGSTDVVTFSLPEKSEEEQFFKTGSYARMTDTHIQLDLLINMSENSDRGPYRALKLLADGARQYFAQAANLQTRYEQQLRALYSDTGDQPEPVIRMEAIDGTKHNISDALAQPEIETLQLLLSLISENIDQDDNVFESRLNEFLNKNQ